VCEGHSLVRAPLACEREAINAQRPIAFVLRPCGILVMDSARSEGLPEVRQSRTLLMQNFDRKWKDPYWDNSAYRRIVRWCTWLPSLKHEVPPRNCSILADNLALVRHGPPPSTNYTVQRHDAGQNDEAVYNRGHRSLTPRVSQP
jgi:hypothetical protein